VIISAYPWPYLGFVKQMSYRFSIYDSDAAVAGRDPTSNKMITQPCGLIWDNPVSANIKLKAGAFKVLRSKYYLFLCGIQGREQIALGDSVYIALAVLKALRIGYQAHFGFRFLSLASPIAASPAEYEVRQTDVARDLKKATITDYRIWRPTF
jgi:hypothetical protein